MSTNSYKIIRFYEHANSRVIREGLTLAEAQQHCNNPETSSRTATDPKVDTRGRWFDGYTKED